MKIKAMLVLMKLSPITRAIESYSWFVVSLLLMISVYGVFNKINGAQNLYTYQAEAFLRGNFAIQGNPGKLPGEIIEHNGRIYIPFPPAPAILLTPFVAAFGKEQIRIYWISFAIAIVTIMTLYRILARLDIDKKTIAWVLSGFALGTGYWQVFRASEWVWMFAQLTAVLFSLLSIHEAAHGGRGWLAGLFLGMAFLSRQLSIYLIFFVTALLWNNLSRQDRIRNIILFLAAVGSGVLIYLAFNYYRFGSLESGYADLNYAAFGRSDDFLWTRVSQYGIFSPAYIPFNIIYMFFQGYHLEFGDDTMLQITGIDRFGTSLLAASPFVIATFRARAERLFMWGSWTSVLLPLVHAMFYHNNGFIQYNTQRFSLDFLPVLIILIGVGYKNSSADLQKYWAGMILYSILLNSMTSLLFVP
jgi:4-amino-4-deoxy-L-arabinose transferase-like glycosyltransferase